MLSNLSVNGNQKTLANKVSNTTVAPLVSPVSAEDLANYLGLSLPLSVADESMLNGMLLAASQYYIDYTNNELLARDYTLRYDRYPERQVGYSGLGAMASSQAWWINFLVWPVAEVLSVSSESGLIDFDDDLLSKPCRLFISDRLVKDIIIDYTAGYATAEEIPANAISGILQMAAYLFEHRGGCDSQSAAMDSGALAMWGSINMITNI